MIRLTRGRVLVALDLILTSILIGTLASVVSAFAVLVVVVIAGGRS